MRHETTKPAADAVVTQEQRAELETEIRKILEETPAAPMHGDAEILTSHSSRGKGHGKSTPD